MGFFSSVLYGSCRLALRLVGEGQFLAVRWAADRILLVRIVESICPHSLQASAHWQRDSVLSLHALQMNDSVGTPSRSRRAPLP